jgi:heme/copper-type cytochrome/quinol oxidase subunit 2
VRYICGVDSKNAAANLKNLPTYGEIKMTNQEAKTVNLIFNVTFSLVAFVVTVALMLAYFDCLTK